MNHTVEALKRHKSVQTYIFLGLFAIMALQSFGERVFYAVLGHSQVLRDLAGVTPFQNVIVTRTMVTDEGLKVWGTFENIGCTITERFAFTRDMDGTRHIAIYIRPDGRVPPLDPAMPGMTQSFGPITIQPISDEPHAGGIAFRGHDCIDPVDPQNTIAVTNLFFDVPWATSDQRQPQIPTLRP